MFQWGSNYQMSNSSSTSFAIFNGSASSSVSGNISSVDSFASNISAFIQSHWCFSFNRSACSARFNCSAIFSCSAFLSAIRLLGRLLLCFFSFSFGFSFLWRLLCSFGICFFGDFSALACLKSAAMASASILALASVSCLNQPLFVGFDIFLHHFRCFKIMQAQIQAVPTTYDAIKYVQYHPINHQYRALPCHFASAQYNRTALAYSSSLILTY